MPIEKTYKPSSVEKKWRTYWKQHQIFSVDEKKVSHKDNISFTILMPPPNVTGSLTIGHVLNHTIQDIFIRYNRMRGKETLWLPGTDHAGIATQTAVEKKLKKEKGLTRHNLGRDKFLREVWAWKEKYGTLITRQLEELGISCDWNRAIFTMDRGPSKAVNAVFKSLYNEELIYKGNRIINWCPASQTALSDEEVIMKPQKDQLVKVKYLFSDDPSQFILVATVRPETILADVAVAINPNDERYKSLVGKHVVVPLTKRKIPIIEDAAVDPAFGTGVLKVTPAHDAIDFDISERHHLKGESVIGMDGRMTCLGYQGMDRFEARKKIIEDLAEKGCLFGIEDYQHNVGYSEREGVQVEPLLSEQWFVRMKPLAKEALKAVEEGHIRFHPEYWVSTYQQWMENIKDWCISRQLWWGHRIPAYYRKNDTTPMIANNKEEAKTLWKEKGIHVHLDDIYQDNDVLDTWFSSWLWPLITFGWEKPQDDNDMLRTFYPTQVLVTGPDIIFFWVARMVMASLHFKGTIPFQDVYFTSIIRDSKGRKLSKSLGNSPDPLEIMATYGTDALRFTTTYLSPLGRDICFSSSSCELGRNFATKLWNAARFLFINQELLFPTKTAFEECYVMRPYHPDKSPASQWIFSKLAETIKSYHSAYQSFHVHEMTKIIHRFVWEDFCDWFLEALKIELNNNKEDAKNILVFAIQTFEHALSLLHPIMPFITEELWHHIVTRKNGESLSLRPLPKLEERSNQKNISFSYTKKLVFKLRSVRTLLGVPPSAIASVFISSTSNEEQSFIQSQQAFIEKLSRSKLFYHKKPEDSNTSTIILSLRTKLFIQLEGMIDTKKEKQRIQDDMEQLTSYMHSVEKKISSQAFLEKAPASVRKKEEEKLANAKKRHAELSLALQSIS